MRSASGKYKLAYCKTIEGLGDFKIPAVSSLSKDLGIMHCHIAQILNGNFNEIFLEYNNNNNS
jgi:hypothetical protein